MVHRACWTCVRRERRGIMARDGAVLKREEGSVEWVAEPCEQSIAEAKNIIQISSHRSISPELLKASAGSGWTLNTVWTVQSGVVRILVSANIMWSQINTFTPASCCANVLLSKPSSLRSDQLGISPGKVTTSWNVRVMRIKEVITKDNWYLNVNYWYLNVN